MEYNFFATISRMKYIERWALMRNSRNETLSEHSLEVAMIAHALCVIGNTRYNRDLDADKAALIGIYHDASEIITGDMPTPVKYYNPEIRDAYKQVEMIADFKLLEKLPADIRPVYEEIFRGKDKADEKYMRRLVKAADKISAYIIDIPSASRPSFFSINVTAPPSISPARVPITRPSSGVRPIEVSMHLPSTTAAMEPPLPTWQVTIFVPSAGMPRNSQARADT